MAWSNPVAATPGQNVSATFWNTNINNNLNALRDYMLGAQDLGSTWEIASGRELRFSAAGVAHGITTIAETDQYLRFATQSATEGGAYVIGISDANRAGLQLYGINGQAAAPTQGGIWFNAFKANGTGTQAFASSEMAMQFVNGSSTLAQWFGAGLNIVGGLSVGYSGVPTSGALTIGDATFELSNSGGFPTIAFDGSNDAIIYARSTNKLQIQIGGAVELEVYGGTPGGLVFPSGQSGIGLGVANTALQSACIVFAELAGGDAAAPAANQIVLFSKDNGAGKTGLYARFSSGATQLVALQP